MVSSSQRPASENTILLFFLGCFYSQTPVMLAQREAAGSARWSSWSSSGPAWLVAPAVNYALPSDVPRPPAAPTASMPHQRRVQAAIAARRRAGGVDTDRWLHGSSGHSEPKQFVEIANKNVNVGQTSTDCWMLGFICPEMRRFQPCKITCQDTSHGRATKPALRIHEPVHTHKEWTRRQIRIQIGRFLGSA